MSYLAAAAGGTINLQATLSASSADPSGSGPVPHHPITCKGQLAYDENGSLRCEHAATPPDDPRTRRCLDHTIALLIIELACAR